MIWRSITRTVHVRRSLLSVSCHPRRMIFCFNCAVNILSNRLHGFTAGVNSEGSFSQRTCIARLRKGPVILSFRVRTARRVCRTICSSGQLIIDFSAMFSCETVVEPRKIDISFRQASHPVRHFEDSWCTCVRAWLWSPQPIIQLRHDVTRRKEIKKKPLWRIKCGVNSKTTSREEMI